MTIEKHQAWGTPGSLPDDGVLVRSDAQARHLVEDCRRKSLPVPPLGLLDGDLCRTVGGKGDEDRIRSDRAMRLPVDLGSVLLDGRQHWFVSHLVIRRSWWWGRVVAVMNAQWIGVWDVAPRSHPNDGLLDVFDANPSFDDRLKVRGRLRTGTHVPHPAIAQSRVASFQLELDRPTPVWLDGERMGSVRTVSVRTEPDALTCVV